MLLEQSNFHLFLFINRQNPVVFDKSIWLHYQSTTIVKKKLVDGFINFFKVVLRKIYSKMSCWSRELGVPQRALLLLDNAPSHPDVEMLSSDDGQISC